MTKEKESKLKSLDEMLNILKNSELCASQYSDIYEVLMNTKIQIEAFEY